MIATRTTLELEPSPLQSTHACSTQAGSFGAVFLHRWVAASRDGTHQRWLPSAVRAFLAFWRSLCRLWGTEQPFLELQERLLRSPEMTQGTPEREEGADRRWQPSLMGAIAARSHPSVQENGTEGTGL